MTDRTDKPSRVLVGASSFDDASAALALLKQVLRDRKIDLGGILVDDTDTLRACRLASQKVVSSSGRLAPVPSVTQMKSLLEADAHAFRQTLADLAAIAKTRWSFERDVGDLIQTSLRSAAAWDVLILAHRNIHPVSGKVVLLKSSDTWLDQIQKMADHLAQTPFSEPVIIRTGDADDPRKEKTADSVLSRLAETNAQAVLLDVSQGPFRSHEQLRRLLDAARCPVFVFGAGSADQRLETSEDRHHAPRDTSKR